uniref:Centromere-associated protein E n=1 Tax=Monodelphis domestica TaxID=13616 RepID=A0A5F8GEU8_MONDO
MAEEGAVTVCVRVRPLISREQALGDATQLHWKTEDRLISQIDGTRSFSFDRVFHSNETTEKVFEEIAVPIIRSAIQGYNGTIFAYGQTASGKTYTMMGSGDSLGVIPKAIHDIFQKIQEIPEREFLLRVSYMEIYNETITDLLCDTRKMKPLEIREDFNRNVYVADLTEEVVSTPELALQWIKKGERNRHYGKTKMNQRSSRSHTIFRMILESREKGDPSNCDGAVMVSHLNLVDLAGSERASQTGSEGLRLKEGCNINRSLFILGQVIKKLSDGQAGGFINYRDSKLTRILQNSLGGNAKTLIICTITPVSLEETLSTLQFASTAKYMKNTPHVNEVLDDEALLKRYRKEIIDLKKQLEEVSSETRVQAMEKDQLAQLLEEKDLLQKVQNDKIQNLTQMLVTSSSITIQQDLKAKRKRRVTWCPGKMNKMKDIGYMDDFDITKTLVAKSVKPALPIIADTDESMCSEFDIFSNTLETISEMEWNPATKLNQENVQSELNSLRANFDNLVLDYEQLQIKNAEIEQKLNEKLELEEFVTLEMQSIKEQEVRNHEILNIMKHEDVSLFLGIWGTGDFSEYKYGEKIYEELKHLKQSLCDTETIALDAQKETAFLKCENLELKEKMKELSSQCKQLEKDNHLYQSQLQERRDSSKRRQADLEKELQSAFSEITRLTSIIEGKYPKDVLLTVELERKVKDLQKDLDKAIKENATLQKEINTLSELKSLPTELEILKKERLEKSEELNLIIAEKDKLRAEIMYKDNRLQELLDEIEKSKEELAAAQATHQTTTQEFQDFKQYHGEFEQNYFTVLEEIEKMKHQIRTVSVEAHEIALDFDDLVSEPTKEVSESTEGEKLLEVREQLCKAQQKLEERLSGRRSSLRTSEEETQFLPKSLHEHLQVSSGTCEKDAPEQFPKLPFQTKEEQPRQELHAASHWVRLNEGQNLESPRNLVPLPDYEKDNELLQQQRKISSLIQEKNQLQQMLECVTAEKNQLKTDLEENIGMSIENQEELRNIGAALKKQQEAVLKERRKTAEKEGELVRTQERLADTEEKLNKKIQELQEKENQMLNQVVNVREENSEVEEKVIEIEQLKKQLKTKECTLERIEMENLELAQKLQASLEETTCVAKERDELTKIQEAFYIEMEQLKETIRDLRAKDLEKQELRIAQIGLKEHQETIDKLKECISEKKDLEKSSAQLQEKIQELEAKQEQIFNVREEDNEDQEKMKEMEQLKEQLMSKESILERISLENLELAQKLQASLEETTSVAEERDELTKIKEALHIERDQLKETIRDLRAKIQELESKQEQMFNVREDNEAQEKMKEMEQLKEQLISKESALERISLENLELAQKLQASLEETTSVAEERDELTKIKEALHIERDQLKKTIRDLRAKDLETQEELRIAQKSLKEHQETVDKLKECISEKEDVEKTRAQLQEKVDLIQELESKQKQMFNVREEDNEAQEKMKEMEQLKEQLISKEFTLERISLENLELAQKLQASLEETTSVAEERDELTKIKEALHIERDQLKKTIRDLRAKIQEHQAKQEHVFNVREEDNKAQEKIKEMEQLKEQLISRESTLERINLENLELAQKLQASLKETTSVTEERDELTKTLMTLQEESHQLKQNITELEAKVNLTVYLCSHNFTLNMCLDLSLIPKGLETQEELRIAQMGLKDHQETIDRLKECVSEKVAQVSKNQEAFEKTKAELQEKIQELQEKKEQVVNVREENSEVEEKVIEIEQLKKQLKTKECTLERIEMENLELAQKLQASLEETTCVTKERDELTKIQEAFYIEMEQLKETIRDLRAKVTPCKDVLMRNKSFRKDKEIQKLQETEEMLLNMKRDMNKTRPQRQSLHQLEDQLKSMSNTLSVAETEKLNLTQKLDSCLSEMNTVIKERDALKETEKALQTEISHLKESLKRIGTVVRSLRKEHHTTVNKFQMDLIREAERQNELLVKTQHLQQHSQGGSLESSGYKLSQKMNLHVEQILKDVSETQNDVHNMIAEFQQLLNAKKEIILFLDVCLNTHFDVECLKKVIQEENDRIVNVNNSYCNKIKAIINESSEFEDKSIIECKEWEHELRQMKEENEELVKKLQTTQTPPTALNDLDALSGGEKKHDLKLRHTGRTTKVGGKSQFDLTFTKDLTLRIIDAKATLGAVFSKEIDDLKMKLVKLNMEKMNESKKFEKEYNIELFQVVILSLHMPPSSSPPWFQCVFPCPVSEAPAPAPVSHTPLTCGGGSGIVQSTKALILKADRVRLEREILKLKQQNEYLTNHQSQLSSNNFHLVREVKKWKERALKKEAQEVPRVHSPKSPRLAEATPLKRQCTSPLYKEQVSQETRPKDSPKPWAFDGRSKSLPVTCLNNYFDNSGLGLLPEAQIPRVENSGSLLDQWQASSGKDAPECRTQ